MNMNRVFSTEDVLNGLRQASQEVTDDDQMAGVIAAGACILGVSEDTINELLSTEEITEKIKDYIKPADHAMGITGISGLYVARNDLENFNVLVCAQDEEEAMKLAVTYFFEGNFTHHDPHDITISEFDDINTHFDCDYIIA